MEGRLVELVNSFESTESVCDLAREGLEFLRKHGLGEHHAHSRLCCAMLRRANGGNADMKNLLHFAGDSQVLIVVSSNITHVK